jgi:hypothetical protein
VPRSIAARVLSVGWMEGIMRGGRRMLAKWIAESPILCAGRRLNTLENV